MEQYPKQYFENKRVTPDNLKEKWPNITELAIIVILNDLNRQAIARYVAQNQI